MSLNDTTIDLRHLGRTKYVASQLLATRAGPVLVDVGPGSTLPALETGLAALGLRVEELHAVLLSHIHFDHAGATGLLVERNPGLEVYVHTSGARHLVSPAKLIASATRIYGEDMDRLWGKLVPVPEANIRPLSGGEHLEIGGRSFAVAAAPGHASHHLAYFEAATGTAFVGDNGGMRVPALPLTMPVTPPPDFDLEAWVDTIDRIEAWRPQRLMCTHFGLFSDPAQQFADLRRGLVAWTDSVRRLLDTDLPDHELADQFHADVMAWLGERAPAEVIRSYAEFADFRASFNGIARYYRKPVRTLPAPS